MAPDTGSALDQEAEAQAPPAPLFRLARGPLIATFAVSIGLFLLAGYLVFTGVTPPYAPAGVSDADYEPPEIMFDFARFSDIPAWPNDNLAEAVPVFLRSCARFGGVSDAAPANRQEALGPAHHGLSLSGRVGDWRPICVAAAALAAQDLSGEDAQSAARRFFESHFRVLKITSRRAPKQEGDARWRRPVVKETGLFTGYFEPVYEASLQRTDRFAAPLYARPDDLVMVDLGAFRQELAGQRIAGSVKDGSLVPYPDHQAIDEGALGARARVIAWLDPNDLLFLQIQGSGRLELAGGGEMRVGYDGQNGHPYTPVGRVLIERGELKRENVSMASIRAWLDRAAPDAARALREANASYVFFRTLDDLENPALGPLGAGGAQLTPGRSLAVDRRYYALGTPVWVVASKGGGGDGALDRLFIAQDTGGAIRGPVRGDIFFGAGKEAGDLAGAFKAEGEAFALVPTSVAARLALASARAQS